VNLYRCVCVCVALNDHFGEMGSVDDGVFGCVIEL